MMTPETDGGHSAPASMQASQAAPPAPAPSAKAEVKDAEKAIESAGTKRAREVDDDAGGDAKKTKSDDV